MDLEQRVRDLELSEVRGAVFTEQLLANARETTQNLKELQITTFELVKNESKIKAYFQILGAIVMIFGGGAVGVASNYLSHMSEINREQDTKIEVFMQQMTTEYNTLELRLNRVEFQLKDFSHVPQ